MGYMRHHAIVVSDYDKRNLEKLQAQAKEIFPSVSEILYSEVNGYGSFFIPTDGSKEGWPESEEGDERRNKFVEILKASEYPQWVEVQYGDDERETKACRNSDEHYQKLFEEGEL